MRIESASHAFHISHLEVSKHERGEPWNKSIACRIWQAAELVSEEAAAIAVLSSMRPCSALHRKDVLLGFTTCAVSIMLLARL